MIVTRAPLRIPLGGGGTDFPNYYTKYGGLILGFAITKYVYVVLHRTLDKKIRLKYSKNEVVDDVDELENRVAAEALKAYNVTKGVEVATFSDVPESSGLGGSSAFCTALVVALRHLCAKSLDRYEIFRSTYDIERIKANQVGGIQDQLFASLGGAWTALLDEVDKPLLEMLDVSKLVPKLRLVYVGSSRLNSDIAARQVRDTDLESKSVLDSLRKVKELGLEIHECLRTSELDTIGSIFNTHWESKKSRCELISNTSSDAIYSKALTSGATGGKLVGSGGGGYFLFYVPEKLVGFETVGFEVDWEGCRVLHDWNS